MAKRLFVGGLPYSTTEEELRNFFASAGEIESVTIIMDRLTGRSKGFAFVEMKTEEEAQKAISSLNGSKIEERSIVVAEAKPLEPREDRGGFSGGRSFGRDDRRGGDRGGYGRDSRSTKRW